MELERTLQNLEGIEWEKYIKSILAKPEESWTKDEREDVERWNDDLMRAEFTILGGF